MANAADFGAKGDGVTDDTDALQHTLDAGDGVLRLNKGVYRISRPLLLDLPRQGFGGVRGEVGTSKLLMTGPGPALRIVGDHRGTAMPRSYQPKTWDKERFPLVTGIEIVGAHPEADGIELRKTTKCTISQVLVRQCRHGVHLVERNRDFILADSHLYDNREIGLFFDECDLHQIVVHGNHISWNKVAGIKSQNGDVHNLQIVGNDIEYNNVTSGLPGKPAADDPALAGHHGGAEIWFEATKGVISEVTISGNTIQATVQKGGANIRVVGAPIERPAAADATSGAGDTAHLIAVTGNILGSQWRALDLENASRITVVGNTIYDSADLSIRAVRCSGLAIGANTFSWRGVDTEPIKDGLWFEDCDQVAVSGIVAQRLCAGSAEQGGAVTFLRCQDSSISDCQLIDPLVRGVDLIDSRRCRVTNNTIVDRRATVTMLEAVRVRGTGKHNLVRGNLLGKAKHRAATVEDGAAIVEGNVHLDD